MNTLVRVTRLAAAVSLLAIAPLAAHAQANNFEFTIGAGAAFPTGSFGDHHDVGYNLNVGIGTKQATTPLGFRLEGMYNEWNVSGVGDFKRHAGGVLANATYDIPLSPAGKNKNNPGNTLYGIGGLGWLGTGDGDTHLGWNIGGGFRFPLTGFSAFVEARYHSVSDGNVKFVPVTFGLAF